MLAFNGKQKFPCPVCTVPREVLMTKKDTPSGISLGPNSILLRPYLTCDPCGVQVFARGSAGIKEFSRLLEGSSEEALLSRLNHMEQRYRLTCPECGHKFWITPKLIKTSVFDGSMKGFRCPERGCDGVASWEEDKR